MRSAIASMIRSQPSQHVEVVFVVGDFDQRRVILVAQRGRRQFFQVLDGAQDDAVLVTFLGRQVEQHDRHLGVDAVRSDLRAHHARAQHGDFLDGKIGHGFYPFALATG
jgi:hypothetical protein